MESAATSTSSTNIDDTGDSKNNYRCSHCHTLYMYELTELTTNGAEPYRVCDLCKRKIDNTVFQKYQGYHF